MSEPDKIAFLDSLQKSELISAEKFASWSQLARGSNFSAKQLALDLVSKNLLTRWQAKMLLGGYHRLRLGNYVLTDRIARTDLGDRFAAVHRQLSRDVMIQYLPSELCQQTASRKRVFDFASKLMKLDHPNLIHVLDADEEGGRIYLVSESTGGRSLSEFDLSQLDNLQRLQIAHDVLSAVRHAHKNGVVHGRVDATNIVLNQALRARLVGLTKHAVGNELSGNHTDAASDLSAFASLANDLLPAFLGANEESAQEKTQCFDELRLALANVTQNPAEVLRTLEQCQKASVGQRHSTNQNAPTKAIEKNADAIPKSNHAEPSPHQSAKQKKRIGVIESAARHNPLALLTGSVLASVILICGTVYTARNLSIAPAVAQNAVTHSSNTIPTKMTPKAASLKATSREKQIVATESTPMIHADTPKVAPAPKPPHSAEQDGDNSTSVLGSMTDPEVNEAAIAAIFNARKNNSDKTTSKNASAANHSTALSSPPRSTNSNSTRSIAVPTVTVAPKLKVTAPETDTIASASALTKKSSTEKIEFLPPGADPFKNFPSSVDLSSVENTESNSLGKLILEKNHLLGVEILCTEAIHKSRPIFEILRSQNNRQAWEFVHRKKSKSPPTVIATLIKKPNELLFSWTDAAKDVKLAGYLRNCKLRLSTVTNAHWVSLRKPIRIEGFKFTDAGNLKQEIEIPDLPQLAALTAAADVVKVKANSTSRKYGSLMSPAEIRPGFPARMFFEDDVDRFLSIDIAADVRKNLVLQAALVLQPIPNEPGLPLPPAQTAHAMARVREMAILAKQDYERAKASNLSTDEKKVFSGAAKALKGRAELTDYYEHIVPQIVGQDIPFRLTFSLNEQHRVVLAETVAQSEDKDK